MVSGAVLDSRGVGGGSGGQMLELRDIYRGMTEDERKLFLSTMSSIELETFVYNWDVWARVGQRWCDIFPDDSKPMTLVLAGRGWGKSRVGAEMVKEAVKRGAKRLLFLGATNMDVVNTMIEGESGLLSVYPHGKQPVYKANKNLVEFPNGAVATTASSESPERVRGGNNHFIWGDELCAWKNNTAEEMYNQAMLSLRKGMTRGIMTTTPKPTDLLKELLRDPLYHVVRGRTYDNLENLSDIFIQQTIKKYEGTRLGLQELEAQVLDDETGALFKTEHIGYSGASIYDMMDLVVAVDPACGEGVNNDDTGIIVAGRCKENMFHVFADKTGKYSPAGWAAAVGDAYNRYECNGVAAEVNQGGDMVVYTLKVHNIALPVRVVRAMRAKELRAQPVMLYYEQGKGLHKPGLVELEKEMTTWIPGSKKSPNRLDALVWAFYALFEKPSLGLTVGRVNDYGN
jgi:phage terminase large subunit-like protein